MKKSNPALFITLLVLLLLLVIQRSFVPRAPSPGGMPGSSAEQAGASPMGRDAPRRAYPPEVFSRTGDPQPAMPFERGENQRRSHPAPVVRDLADGQAGGEPAVLAMTPADGRLELLPGETDLHTLRARRMVLNTAALDQVIDGRTSRLLAPTTGGEVLELDIRAVKSRSAQSHTLTGRVSGEEETSDVQLVYHDGIIHGTIARHTRYQHLEYRILADGHMMVRELDSSTMTAMCGNPGETPEDTAQRLNQELSASGIELEASPPENGDTARDSTGWTTIDVVVGYDRQARIDDGGVSQIEARIIASVDRMSTAFANSLVTQTELMLLGTIEDPDYNFPGNVSNSMSGELGDLNNPTNGALDTVSDYASELGADFKSFVVKQADGSAGIAYLPGTSSIVARDYMTSNRITFAHELGHNLGCDHSWGDSSQAVTHSRYGWRFIGTNGTKARTIMAYDWNWGTRVPYFSNPAVTYLGARTGAVNGYNVLVDPTADPRYFQGGLGYSGSSSTRFGFNGSNPSLGANNAMLIRNGGGQYGAAFAANRTARAALAVTSPAGGAEWLEGSTRTITFKGGDMDYTASVQLYKGGQLRNTISSGFNAIKRSLQWTVPAGLPVGSDYTVRLTLSHPQKPSVSVDSGAFTITNLATIVVSQSPEPTTPASGPLSQLKVSFSAPMNPAAFSIGEHIRSFTGPAGVDLLASITGVSWANGNTELTVGFAPQSTLGYYRMVFSGKIENVNGTRLDQDQDGTEGELVDDSYVALVWVVASGQGLETIWSDLVGTDTLDSGYSYSTNIGKWQVGTPGENGISGPGTAFDGGPIIAQNLTGNYNSGENTWIATPTINCGNYKDVTLTFKGWKGAGQLDTLYVDVWYAGAWKRIYRHYGGAVNDGAWIDYSVPLVSFTGEILGDFNQSMKVRWGLVDSSGTASATGWQIDAIVVKGVAKQTVPPFPRVVAHNPAGIDPQSVGSVWVDFSQPMDTGGFSLADIDSFTGPAGAITATGFHWISNSLLRIDFPLQSALGDYALTIGPQLPDAFGNLLDQDGDGVTGEPGQDAYQAKFVIGVVAGPLDHFAIAGIGELQTVDTPIGGITITAKDAAGVTVEDFTGTVEFGGTGGFSGSSANFVAGVLNDASVTPTASGINLTLTVDDGAGHTGSTAITTIQTQFTAWAGGMASDDDANGDGIKNGMAWVLGAADPQENAIGLLPAFDDTGDPEFRIFNYRRRRAALTNPDTSIAVQHGSDLSGWSPLVHDGTNVIITPANDFHGAGIDKVEVKLRRSSFTEGSLFLRLSVTMTDPQSPLQPGLE